MISDIIDFFSNNFLEIVVRFFGNIGSFFYNNIFSTIMPFLPDVSAISMLYNSIDDIFNFVTPYFVFLKDAFMISDITMYFLVAVIILKVGGSYSVWLMKTFLKWWHQLMP